MDFAIYKGKDSADLNARSDGASGLGFVPLVRRFQIDLEVVIYF